MQSTDDDRRRIRFWRPDYPSVTGMLRVEHEDRMRTTYSEHFLVAVVYEGAFDGWYRGAVRTHVAGAIKLKEPGEVHATCACTLRSRSRARCSRTRRSQRRRLGARASASTSSTPRAGASFDAKRGREIVASGEIRNGTYESNEGATRFKSHVAFPVEPHALDAVVGACCELASSLETGAGSGTVVVGNRGTAPITAWS